MPEPTRTLLASKRHHCNLSWSLITLLSFYNATYHNVLSFYLSAKRSSMALACTNGFKPQTIRRALFAETFFNVSYYYCCSIYLTNCLKLISLIIWYLSVIAQLSASPLWKSPRRIYEQNLFWLLSVVVLVFYWNK